MTFEKSSEVLSFPPTYAVDGQAGSSQTSDIPVRSSTKTKALFGFSVAVTVALVVVLVVGGVYYDRAIHGLQESIKKFHVEDKSGNNPVNEDIEIDMANNYATFYLTGDSVAPGTFAVLDYTKSMTGIYEPRSRRCYLIGGIKSEITDLQTLRDVLEKNITASGGKNFEYVVGNDYPVSDKTILPGPLKNACTSLPVYWLEPAPETPNGVQKRGCYGLCVKVWGVCVGVGFCS